MDTREKLIEILKRIDAMGDASIVGIEPLADNLIENGVTVQQWIPADAPPEDSCQVVIGKVDSEGEFIYVADVRYSNRHKLFNASDLSSDEEAERTALYPDFWMPMPVLHKEENNNA